MDPKNTVQQALVALAEQCPMGLYTHRKGGLYVVFCHSVDEATLTPLVHYYSMDRGTRWTRTIANFVETVDGSPRFRWVREASSRELQAARGERIWTTKEDTARPTSDVRVNDRSFGLQRTTVDYETVVSLADMQGTPSVTVKYPAVDGMPRDRVLAPGDVCDVRDGMSFRVVHTGAA